MEKYQLDVKVNYLHPRLLSPYFLLNIFHLRTHNNIKNSLMDSFVKINIIELDN